MNQTTTNKISENINSLYMQYENPMPKVYLTPIFIIYCKSKTFQSFLKFLNAENFTLQLPYHLITAEIQTILQILTAKAESLLVTVTSVA